MNRNLEKIQDVLLTHGDCIERVAENFNIIATSRSFIVGIANDKLRLYGLQFHPEVIISVAKLGRLSLFFQSVNSACRLI